MLKVDNMQQFEEFSLSLIDQYRIPGVSIGINENGTSTYYRGFGFRDVEKGLPVTGDTVFGIASITKSFTCVAILQLQEAGKLSVQDPVIKYLPELSLTDNEKTAQLTIHHFMTNSSGIPPLPSLIYANKRKLDQDPSWNDYPGLNIDEDDLQQPIDTHEELIDFINKQKFDLLGSPGIHFSYSNDAFALLGAIIARVSGQTYEDYVKDHILIPAGMVNSTFDLDSLEDTTEITMLYAEKASDKSIYAAPVWWDAPSMRAAGYLKSTVNDILNYTEVYRNGGLVGENRILSEESVKQMIYPHIEIDPGKYYGYGLMITPDYYGNTLVEHGGSLKAIASLMSIVPELGISSVVLTNLAGVPASNILRAALNNYQGKDVLCEHAVYEEHDMSITELKRYIGNYTSNEGMQLKIDVENDELTFYTQGSYHSIHCIGKDLFLATIKGQEEIIRFIADDNGEIDRILYHFRQFPRTEL